MFLQGGTVKLSYPPKTDGHRCEEHYYFVYSVLKVTASQEIGESSVT
jgi:hypothetical protein